MPDDALRIIAIRPTQRDANRATVRVGRGRAKRGRVVVTLTLKRIDELGLRVGQAWDDALAQRVLVAGSLDKALHQALNRLSRRPMSRRDLDRKLRDLDHDEPTRAAALDRLEQLGLLDDRAYGEALVRDTQRAKPAGPMLLKQKLYQKGLDARLIDELVADATDDTDAQRDAARALAQSKLRTMSRLDPRARHRRLYGTLARRGFTPGVINDVMDGLRDAMDDESGRDAM